MFGSDLDRAAEELDSDFLLQLIVGVASKVPLPVPPPIAAGADVWIKALALRYLIRAPSESRGRELPHSVTHLTFLLVRVARRTHLCMPQLRGTHTHNTHKHVNAQRPLNHSSYIVHMYSRNALVARLLLLLVVSDDGAEDVLEARLRDRPVRDA